MVESKWSERTPAQIFGNNRFYQWLRSIFAERVHTHPISDVTNLQSSLNSKQDSIPNMSLKTTQTMYGLTVTNYTDGLSVYTTITGNLNGNSALPDNGSTGTLGTISSDYAPYVDMEMPVHPTTEGSKIILQSDGTIRLRNTNSSKSWEVKCSFYYPWKSRI